MTEEKKSVYDALPDKNKVIVEAMQGIAAQQRVLISRDDLAIAYETSAPEAKANTEKAAAQFIARECGIEEGARQFLEEAKKGGNSAAIAAAQKGYDITMQGTFYHGLACKKAEILNSPTSPAK